MDKDLFERLAKQVCLHFGATCEGCPFYEFKKSVGETACRDAWSSHGEASELVLATWIGGVDFVDALGEQEQKKTPETRREIMEAAERCVSPGADVNVDAVTAALLMAELKIARASTNTGHMDSWVDLAGYAACGGEIASNDKA